MYAPNPVPGQENVLIKKEVTSSKVRLLIRYQRWWTVVLMRCWQKGAVVVTAKRNGDHWVCISLDSSEFAFPEGSKMVATMRILAQIVVVVKANSWCWFDAL